MRKPAVFIAASLEGLPIAREFARQLAPSTTATLWREGAVKLGQTAPESLTELADNADFAIFILTADDTGSILDVRSKAPLTNLFFELGFVAGRIGLSRTFIVQAEPGPTIMPSDFAGIMFTWLRSHPRSDLPAAVAPVVAGIAKAVADLGLRSDRRTELSSCFISYSWKDTDFAKRLHDDLVEIGVRCWLDAKEIRVGDNIPEQIDRAIQAHDKVLLVLSQSSIRSKWVHAEIQKAFGLERAREATVLFPLRLDDAVFTSEGTTEIDRLKDRLVLDFSGWHEKSQYQRAFSRLVRDLAISASVESGRGQ